MVDLGQKKVELSTFFYVPNFVTKNGRESPRQFLHQKPMRVGYYLCWAYRFATSSQLITLKKASIYAGR